MKTYQYIYITFISNQKNLCRQGQRDNYS